MKNYFHVIEDSGYGNVGSHGFYNTEKEAKEEANRLQELFPNYTFYVFISPSKKEPVFVTI